MENAQANRSREEVAALPRAKGRFVSHVFMLITGNGIAQTINALGALALARLFAPNAFGVFALFVAAVSVLAVLGGGRYELSIMLPDDDAEAANLLTLSSLVLLGLALACLLIVTLFHDRVAALLGDPVLSQHLWSIPLALFVVGFYQVLTYWAGRMKRFKEVATSRVYQAMGIIGGQLALLPLVGNGGSALVGGWIFGQSLGMFYLLIRIVQNERRFLLQSHDWSVVRLSVRKYRNFPLYKAPYSFVSNASSQFVPMILQMFSGLDVVGLYSMANRAVSLPVSLIASSMNQVFYEKAASELRYGRMESFVTRILRVQILLATPVLVLIAFDIKPLFGLVLGGRWAAAGVFAAILAWVGYLSFLTSWLDRLFDVRGRQRLSLILAAAGNAAAIGGLFATLSATRNAVIALGVYAGLQALYISLWLVVAYHIARFSLRSLAMLAKHGLTAAAISLAVIWIIHLLLPLWVAIGFSAAAVFLMDCVYFIRYVPGSVTATLSRLRAFVRPREA